MRISRRAILAIVLLSVLVSVLAVAEGGGETRWLAPAPRLENGRFENPVGPIGHGTLGVRFPFMLRRIRASFDVREGAPVHAPVDGAFFRGPNDGPRVTWIGHATVLVEMDGVRFLTDPTWSETASPVSFAGPPRLAPPGVAMEALPPIDFVVVSHNHYDHLDLASLVALAERDPLTQFIVPLGNGELLRDSGIARVIELDWTETTRVGTVDVHCLPVQHWSKRSLIDDDRALWSSWAVTGPTRRFYFGGDTGYFDGFREIGEALGPFDLAALPIGAYEPREMMALSHMNPEEAWQAALDVRAEAALGVHFGTFDLSDEDSDEPPRRFRARARQGEREADAWVLDVGESRSF
ncbi:MAG: MBL fold metallo-hydrolase [bacterium]|nr:MBL fold metallo-hydrolase [bacterium]